MIQTEKQSGLRYCVTADFRSWFPQWLPAALQTALHSSASLIFLRRCDLKFAHNGSRSLIVKVDANETKRPITTSRIHRLRLEWNQIRVANIGGRLNIQGDNRVDRIFFLLCESGRRIMLKRLHFACLTVPVAVTGDVISVRIALKNLTLILWSWNYVSTLL